MVLKREVAVKLLPLSNEEHKARVWREARLAALLSEDAAVPVYDFGDDGERCFLVMELMHSPTLRQVIDEVREFPLDSFLEISLLLMRALTKVHAIALVHRDIKPANIFVSKSTAQKARSVRLVDFGLSFLSDMDGSDGLGRLTGGGGLSGTPAYLSPEQARQEEIGRASDIYSAGCVLYEMACGTTPYTGAVGELISKHLYVPAIPLIERSPQSSPAFSDLVDSMLSKSAEARPTADDVLAKLGALCAPEEEGSSERHLRDFLRSRRMVDSRSTDILMDAAAIRIWTPESPPAWLTEKLEELACDVTTEPKSADVCLAQAGGPVEAWHPNAPVVGWWDSDDDAPNLPELIRKGFSSVVTPDMPPLTFYWLLRSLRARPRT